MKNFWKILLGSFLGCCIAMFIFFIILMGAISSIASLSKSSVEPVIPKSAILKLDFNVPITERSRENFSISLMGNVNPSFTNTLSLYQAVKAIQIASEDPAIKFIYMNTDNINIAPAHAEELRSALKKFRESGKAIVSYSNTFSNSGYYLASVSDKILFNSYGDALINGLSTNILFFKDLIDKLGINVQLIRHGKYKAAAEQLIKNNISPENMEQNQVLLNSLWSSWIEEIAASRNIDGNMINKWIDNLELRGPEILVERHLVDQLCYQDQAKDYLCSLFDVKEAKDLKFVSLDKYAKAKVKNNYRAKEKIAVVYADGEIVYDGNDDKISGLKFTEILEKIRKDSTVKAVVLRVNSPGGSAQAAEIINRELDLIREVKPVIASYGNYAASGGYWISAKANKIFTDNCTITGSIGCFSLFPSFGKALNKNLSINNVSISSNKHGDALGGMRPLDAEEQEYIQSMVERIYSDFTSLVAQGRNMTVEQVDNIGQGRVWTGRDALKIGLADTKGGLTDAIEYAVSVAGLEKYQLLELPAFKTTYEKLLESISETEVAISVINNPLKAIEESYMSLKNETRATFYSRLPFIYDIR